MGNFRDNIRKVVPYVPGEQPKRKVIKLNTNENPYSPSNKVMKAMDSFEWDSLRRYPDPDCIVLRKAIADYYGLDTENIFVGVGSDDVIATSFLTFFNSENPLLFPDITYSFYSVWADLYNIKYEKVPVDKDFRIHAEDYYRENGGVIFPNPNAPTAICEPLEFIEDILKNNTDSVVIVDEAYIDFGGKSAIELTKKYENLLVVQTFSKSRSMAGMRIGFAIGNKELIDAMNDVKFSINSYTMNQTSLVMGVASIQDDEYFKETTSKIIATRERIKKELEALSFECTDSKTNFLFATNKNKSAREIFEELKKRDIFVRYFNQPGIDNYLRITIGTDEEMDKLIKELKDIL